MDLRSYNYSTIYNPGLKMAISDCLSRSVHWEDGKQEEGEEQCPARVGIESSRSESEKIISFTFSEK